MSPSPRANAPRPLGSSAPPEAERPVTGPRRTRAAVLALLVLMASGCAGGGLREPGDPRLRAAVAHRLEAARGPLGESMVALNAVAGETVDQLDDLRHRTARGAAVRTGAGALAGTIARLRSVAATASERAEAWDRAVEPEPVRRAAAELATAAGEAEALAAAAEREAAFVEALAEADLAMDAAVGAWTADPETLEAIGRELDALSTRVSGMAALPPECPAPLEHRARWSALLASRTRALASKAGSAASVGEAGSDSFDELRASFRRDPYGEDRRERDAADRDCWRAASAVVELRGTLRARARALDELLSSSGEAEALTEPGGGAGEPLGE